MDRTDARVLVVDDDPAMGKVLCGLLAQDGILSVHVLGGGDALAELARAYFAVVVTDLQMAGMDGMELLRRVHQAYPDIPVIMITAHGNVAVAVEAMKAGAADFVLKEHFERQEFLDTVHVWLTAALKQPDNAGKPASPTDRLVGVGQKLQEARRMLRKAAAGNATVLLRGETGVGKDVAAHTLHDESPRREGPFVTVHCAALPESLLEAELFGCTRGAFTHAVDRPGRVELAAGGTLFLDEIGDLPLPMQVKLLKLLQDKTYERLGDSRSRRADVRFVAATHRNLESRVRSGQFREDLFYRLSVMQIWIPPLRERPEAIEPLATEFCATFAQESNRPGLHLTKEALALLSGRPWRGNVRELRNFIERLTILAEGLIITGAEVEYQLQQLLSVDPSEADSVPTTGVSRPSFPALDAQRKDTERDAIIAALKHTQNNRTLAAKLLGISRRSIYYKLREYGILGAPRD
jgi:two-component system, NtrC family, response regulator AtoC